MTRRVLILGLGRREPLPSGEWEKWALPWGNQDWDADLFFEMHDRAMWDKYAPPGYVYEMNYSCVPVVVSRPVAEVQNCIQFPWREAEATCGALYFESSIAYMLAYAIVRQVDEIAIWGVGVPFDEGYVSQRANMEYLIGLARGRGIKVQIMPGSWLLRSEWAAGCYGVHNDGVV